MDELHQQKETVVVIKSLLRKKTPFKTPTEPIQQEPTSIKIYMMQSCLKLENFHKAAIYVRLQFWDIIYTKNINNLLYSAQNLNHLTIKHLIIGIGETQSLSSCGGNHSVLLFCILV